MVVKQNGCVPARIVSEEVGSVFVTDACRPIRSSSVQVSDPILPFVRSQLQMDDFAQRGSVLFNPIFEIW